LKSLLQHRSARRFFIILESTEDKGQAHKRHKQGRASLSFIYPTEFARSDIPDIHKHVVHAKSAESAHGIPMRAFDHHPSTTFFEVKTNYFVGKAGYYPASMEKIHVAGIVFSMW
jgi:hypothetical protein